MDHGQEEYRTHYYVPEQLVFVAEHNSRLASNELVEKVKGVFAYIYPFLREMGYSNDEGIPFNTNREGLLQIERKSTLHNREFFTVLTINLEGEATNFLARIVKVFYDEKDNINQQICDNELKAEDYLGFRVEAISPNWLGTPAQTGSADGGPGGWPRPASNPTGHEHDFEVLLPLKPETCSDKHKMAINELHGAFDKRPNKGVDDIVHVAILDAFPEQGKCDAAMKDPQGHEILKSLGSKFRTITPVPQMESLKWVCPEDVIRHGLHVKGHNYRMPDHGIFIAGIIHTIAPKATIHPIRVLNEFGVGTLESVSEGLKAAQKIYEECGGLFIVNMSLMFTLPRNDDKHSNDKLDPELIELFQNYPDAASSMMSQIGWLHDEMAVSPKLDCKVQIVAAAGNDWDDILPQPVARFPAALRDIIGVGAFNKTADDTRYGISTYSNASDWTRGKGVLAFGGNVEIKEASPNETKEIDKDKPKRPDTHPEFGMLGVYISERFPHPTEICKYNEDEEGKNDSRWARWSGTSFAAPVVAGVLALLGTLGKNLDEAEYIIRAAASSERLQSNPNAEVEDVLPVQQIPRP